MSDYEHYIDYKVDLDALTIIASRYIERHWGTRCEEYEEKCECCQKWKAFDVLAEDVF